MNGVHAIGGGAIPELTLVIPPYGPQGAIGFGDQGVPPANFCASLSAALSTQNKKITDPAAATHLRPGTIYTSTE